MNSDLDILNAYSGRGLLIDTNLLLLFFVGLHDRRSIPQFKRTQQFVPEDFDCLAAMIQRFKQVVTTPNILTEVSNLLGQLTGRSRLVIFRAFSLTLQRLEESFTPSRELAQETCFPRFGLTDAGIVHGAKGKYLVLTDDFPLAGYLQKQGIDAVNFNHLRAAYW